MAFTIGRLAVDDPESWSEQLGDPIGNQGAAVVPGVRAPARQTGPPLTIAPTGSSDLLADRLRLRRQLRSLLNNTPLKLAGLYVAWDTDNEQNGLYVPDQGGLIAAFDNPLAHGLFKVDGLQWAAVAKPRTHRRAVGVYLKDRRLSTTWRDYFRQIYSTDFSGLTALAVTYLPAGVSDVINVVSGAAIAAGQLPGTTADGGTLFYAAGLTDLAVTSFEQAEANRNLGDVIVRDRRGTITAPAGGPDPAWEEVYGPDYPVSAADVPVIENGRVRVRYDSSNSKGFRVDFWTGAAWAEQGKVCPQRIGDATGLMDTLLSATVLEWTPDRAVLLAVMRNSADGNSRERVVITLQRGWAGPRVEVYPAAKAAGTAADAALLYYLGAADTNNSAAKIDAAGAGATVATAGSGSANFGATAIGAATFTGENEVVVLRQGATVAVSLAVLQVALAATTGNDSNGYGSARNFVKVAGSGGLAYCSTHLGFYAQATDQVMEAEAMTAGAGTTSPVVDAAASNGNSTTAVRTTDANPHVTKATWLTAAKGKYRVFVRVKTTASTLNTYAKTTATTGATKTTTSTTFVWLDLGDIVADGSTLEIHDWATAAATTSVDRVEAYKVEDRTATVPAFDGGRDLAQAILYDSRSPQRWVTR